MCSKGDQIWRSSLVAEAGMSYQSGPGSGRNVKLLAKRLSHLEIMVVGEPYIEGVRDAPVIKNANK